jgi:4'-phosphopantetheinyl transferase
MSATAVAPGVVVAVGRLDSVLSRLSPDPLDAARAAALAPARAREYLAARCLLRELLSDAGLPAASRVAAEPSGRPYLPDLPKVGISLSHCGARVAASVGIGHAVGIDVQTPQPVRPELISRCCAPDVCAELASLSPEVRAEEFAWIWTVQESCVKASGMGLAGQPWRIPVRPGQCTGTWRGYIWHTLRDRYDVPVSWAARPLAKGDGSGGR